MFKKALALSLIGALVVTTGAASIHGAPRAHAAMKHYKIVLIAGIASDAFYISMNRGAQMEAKKLGATVQFSGSPAAFSPSTQLPYLNAAIAQKPDLILIAPTDKVALQAPIQKAVSAGIAVILVDTTLGDPSIAVTTISSDNVAGGVAAGNALAKAVGKKGKVAGVSVTPGISTTDQRLQGFEMAIKKYAGITNIGTTFAGDNTTRAASILKGLVAAHKDLTGVFAMNVVTGDGVTAAARESGVGGKLKLVEFDAGPSQVQGLKAGTITALIAQEPLMIGTLGVRYGVQYLNGNKSLKKHYGTPSVIVTKSNVDDPSVAQFLYTK